MSGPVCATGPGLGPEFFNNHSERVRLVRLSRFYGQTFIRGSPHTQRCISGCLINFSLKNWSNWSNRTLLPMAVDELPGPVLPKPVPPVPATLCVGCAAHLRRAPLTTKQPRAKGPWPTGAQRAARVRSRVTNGATYLTLRDSGSPSARRLRDLVAMHTADLGGVDNCTTAELVLVRRAAQLSLQLEILEERFAGRPDGEAPTKKLDAYQRCTNTLRRVLETLGLQRRTKDVTPTVADYVAHIAQEEAADAAD